MHPAILEFLERQQREGFPDVAGTELSATIPLTDASLNQLLAALLPADAKIREVLVTADDGNRFAVKVRLSGPSLLPAISVPLKIDEQPRLPERPVLGLTFAQPSRFVSMAASTLPAMVTLPPGVHVHENGIAIDLARLLAAHGLDRWLALLTDLRLSTRKGAIVLDVRARLGPT